MFPYATDAPVYYWPFATAGIIFLNLVVFVGVLAGSLGSPEGWILHYGDGIHPDQWLKSIFMHGSVGHLIGNMMFLWVFGLVVEGKLGWWKFLLCYLGIGITQSAIEQMVMLGYDGMVPGSLGASAAVFGLMAISAIWAPMNEVSFVFLFIFRLLFFEISFLTLAGFYVGLELLFLMVSGGTAGSSWLHLNGVLLGIPVGIVLLKKGLVDCEGWDIFHVLRGDYGAFRTEPDPEEVFAKVDEERNRRDAQVLKNALPQVQTYLQQGNLDAALLLINKMRVIGPGIVLERGDLATLIKLLHAERRWQVSAPFMMEFITQFPEGSDAVRVKLAQICVVELQRPRKALELLQKVDPAILPAAQLALAKKIAEKAKQMLVEGELELDDEAL